MLFPSPLLSSTLLSSLTLYITLHPSPTLPISLHLDPSFLSHLHSSCRLFILPSHFSRHPLPEHIISSKPSDRHQNTSNYFLTSFSVAGALNTCTASTGLKCCLNTINRLLAMKGQVIIFNGFARRTSWNVKSRTVFAHSLCSSKSRTLENRVHISSKTVWPNLNIWVSEWVNKWVSEWVSQWVNKWVNKWVSEWVSER